jgi:hypothetical protein
MTVEVVTNTVLTEVYDDATDLSNAFDEYCYENGVSMSNYWEDMAENWSVDEFGDHMADMDINTIQECIDYFC